MLHDVTILGMSIAGVAAALRIKMSGARVRIFAIPDDDTDYNDTFFIPPSPLTGGARWRYDLTRRLDELLRSADSGWAPYPPYKSLSLEHDSLLVEWKGERLPCPRVVYAPRGIQDWNAWEDPRWKEIIHAGLTGEASSDACLMRGRGRKCVVVGSSLRALDGALILAEECDDVLIVSEEMEWNVHPALTQLVTSSSRIRVLRGSRILSATVRSQSSARSASLVLHGAGGGTRTIDADHVFVSSGWACPPMQCGEQAHVAAGLLHPAGLANGIKYEDFDAQFWDGWNVAERLLRERRSPDAT